MDINEEIDEILRLDHEARLAEVRAFRGRWGFPADHVERTPEEEEVHRIEFDADMESLDRAVTREEFLTRFFEIYQRNKEREKREREEEEREGVDQC